MPRFSMKSLLIAFALIALWLSTASLPDPAGTESGGHIRSAMLFSICLISGFATIYFRGRRQAFWAGFFLTMVLLFFQFGIESMPSLWLAALTLGTWLGRSFGVSGAMNGLFIHSVWAVLLIGFSTVVGIVAAYIYDQSQQDKDG